MHSFYAHLISYFFFHPTKSLQLIGAVGKNESKIALNFHHEALVKTLTGKTQYQRELYCLTALYEMSNMLAYKLFMYYTYVTNRNFNELAALENQFLNWESLHSLMILLSLRMKRSFSRIFKSWHPASILKAPEPLHF